jgi:hypothetical protein
MTRRHVPTPWPSRVNSASVNAVTYRIRASACDRRIAAARTVPRSLGIGRSMTYRANGPRLSNTLMAFAAPTTAVTS